jgi:signal transduction histidine kinase
MRNLADRLGTDDCAYRRAADRLVEEQLASIARRTDRMFARLMGLQWTAGVAAALWFSPRAWATIENSIEVHVCVAVFLGGALAALPIYLAAVHPGCASTRYTIAVTQALWTALLIHLCGGRIETHFHVFGSLAFLACYRRWSVLLTATAVVALDHVVRGAWWPQSVYGVWNTNPWRTLEHVGWILFEAAFLWFAMRHSLIDMRDRAVNQMRVERARELVEEEVQLRTRELHDQIAERVKAEQTLAVHQQLVDMARRAGMADTATSVLHNVGNVLNSINVSATLARDRLKQSKVGQLRKVADVVEANAADLVRFFSQDAKGKQLPGLLRLLASHLGDERDDVLKEVESLCERVGHVKTIVATQQSYARMSGVIEECDPARTLDDAIRFNSSSFDRHGIVVIRDYADVPKVALDKQKLILILVNLIKNAKDSLAESASEVRALKLRTYVRRGDRLVLEVGDTGMGIAQENLKRIFAHGFTTKKNGHGFGLHSCANAATEMGGSLAVRSDGPGKGATFTLELPFAPAEVPHESACVST